MNFIPESDENPWLSCINKPFCLCTFIMASEPRELRIEGGDQMRYTLKFEVSLIISLQISEFLADEVLWKATDVYFFLW